MAGRGPSIGAWPIGGGYTHTTDTHSLVCVPHPFGRFESVMRCVSRVYATTVSGLIVFRVGGFFFFLLLSQCDLSSGASAKKKILFFSLSPRARPDDDDGIVSERRAYRVEYFAFNSSSFFFFPILPVDRFPSFSLFGRLPR